MNKHGLTRYIPAEIKRDIRQRCGFGCVICGLSIYEYEHIDPVFENAREHDPEKIALLCPNCHAKVTKNIFTKDLVKNALQNPKAKQSGFSRETFHVLYDPNFYFKFSGFIFERCRAPIAINGKPLFSIRKPEVPDAPMLFSGTFTNDQGIEILKIVDNEWFSTDKSWDIEATGQTIVFRKSLGDQQLKIRFDPPRGLIIERIKMRYGFYSFDGNQEKVKISYLGVPNLTAVNCGVNDCVIGLDLGCSLT